MYKTIKLMKPIMNEETKTTEPDRRGPSMTDESPTPSIWYS